MGTKDKSEVMNRNHDIDVRGARTGERGEGAVNKWLGRNKSELMNRNHERDGRGEGTMG